jgi:hypothetical protein
VASDDPDQALQIEVMRDEIIRQRFQAGGNGPSSGMSSTGEISGRLNSSAHMRFTSVRAKGLVLLRVTHARQLAHAETLSGSSSGFHGTFRRHDLFLRLPR